MTRAGLAKPNGTDRPPAAQSPFAVSATARSHPGQAPPLSELYAPGQFLRLDYVRGKAGAIASGIC